LPEEHYSNIPGQQYEGAGWRKFMKIVIAEAKNERVLNYINFTNQVKV